jgi:general transcription factor 3C polypeptide 6
MMQDVTNSGSTESDSDYELEGESLVHVEVAGVLQDDLAHHTATSFVFVDIDSNQPLVQVGNQVFVGEYRDTIGTSVFFHKAPQPQASTDPVFGHKIGQQLTFLEKTNKKLVLKRVFLKPKETASNDSCSDKT